MQRFKNLELRKISINTFFQFLIRISTSIPTFIATILIAYYAGFETLGSFTKIIAFVSVFYIFVDFGMNSLFLKTYLHDTKEKLGNLILLRVILASLVLPVIAFISFLLPYSASTGSGFSNLEKIGIIIFSFTLITHALTISLQAYLQKKLSYSLSFIPSLISSLLLLLLIVFSSRSGNLPLLLFSYVLSGGVLFLLLLFTMYKKFSLNLKSFNLLSFSKNLLISSSPLGIMLIFNLLYAKADTLILAFYRPTVDVGIYGVSYRFFELSIAIPAFMANSVYPLLLNKMDDNIKYRRIFKKYLLFFFLISLVFSFLMIFLSPIIGVLKSDFSKSILPLQLLSVFLPFFFMSSLLQWHFLIKGKIKLLIPLYAFAFLINVIFNIIFVPQYSYIATSLITGFSEMIVFIFLLWYFVKTNKVSK